MAGADSSVNQRNAGDHSDRNIRAEGSHRKNKTAFADSLSSQRHFLVILIDFNSLIVGTRVPREASQLANRWHVNHHRSTFPGRHVTLLNIPISAL